MNKNLTKIAALSVSLAMAIGVGVALGSKAVRGVKAADELFYTLEPAAGSNNSYAGNCDVAINGVTWNINGNSQQIPWRLGGKSISDTDRTVYSKTAMGSAITKVELTVGAASSVTVNSLKMVVASDSGFATQIDSVSKTFAANSTITFTPTSGSNWATGAYYKFVFNLTISATSNKFVEFTRAKFYADGGSVTPTVNSVSVDPSSMTLNLLGTKTGSVEATVNVSGGAAQTVTWSVQDASPAGCVSVSNGTVTANAVGTAKVRATSTVDSTKYADCSVTVVSVESKTFELVTSTSDLEVGATYAITNGKDDGDVYAMSNVEQLKYRRYTTVTVADNEFESTTEVLLLTLSGSTDEWVFTTQNYEGTDGVLYPASGKNNELYIGSSDSTATISFDSEAAVITLSGNSDNRGIIRYNKTSGQERFSCYASGQEPIYLWKEVGGGPALPSMHIGAYDADDPTTEYYAYYHENEGSHTLYLYDEDNNVIADSATFTSSNDNIFAFYQAVGSHGYSFTTVAPGTVTLTASVEGYKSTTRTVTVDAGDVTNLSMSGSMTKTSYSTTEDWDPTGFSVTATYQSGYQGDVTSDVSWGFVPEKPAEGVTSVIVNAFFGGLAYSSDAQAVTVTVAHAGTAEDPFTVTEGIAKAKEIGTTAAGPWVTQGIISKVTEWNSSFPNITYWISEDGTGGEDVTKTIQCHRGKYLEGAAITAENCGEFVVGATVVVTGNLVNYNSNTPEYAANNYPLSIVQPSSGDFDVTFEPSTSLEISDTGTFTATADTTNPTFTWSSNDPTVLSVDASTGAFEALALGTARITVDVVDGDKSGSAFADIVVNGARLYRVSEANELAAALPNGATSDWYITVEAYVIEFATSVKDDNPRALDVSDEDQQNRIMVYTNVDPYADFVDGLGLGDAVRVRGQLQNYNGKYEIVNPVRTYKEYVALSFAYEFKATTDSICADYDGVTDNHDALLAVWGTLESKFNTLNDAQKARLVNPDSYGQGQLVKDMMERYDYLTGKYGLTNFIAGRTPTEFVNPYSEATINFNNNSNTMIIIISVIAAVSALSIGALLIIKKRKHN